MKTKLIQTLLSLVFVVPVFAQDLDTLQGIYDREKAKIIEEANAKLLADLKALREKLVAEGNLDGVREVDAQLALLNAESKKDEAENSKKEYVFGPSTWMLRGNRIQFREDGVFSHSGWPKRTTWTAEGNVVTIITPNGRKATFRPYPSGEAGSWRQENQNPSIAYSLRLNKQ